MQAWEVVLEFEIGGGGARGADGMAFWYTQEMKQEGIALGGPARFTGMALFFDTFDNDGLVLDPFSSLSPSALVMKDNELTIISCSDCALSHAAGQPQYIALAQRRHAIIRSRNRWQEW